MYQTHSLAETQKIAAILAKEVLAAPPRTTGALVIALVGDLGSGKTSFTQGFARSLGVRQRTVSPTFTIMRRYALKDGRFRSLVHVDAYRVHKPAELSIIKFHEWLADPKAVVVVEWADLVLPLLPPDAISIRFRHARGRDARTISIGRAKTRR